jgi:hypothetical protein
MLRSPKFWLVSYAIFGEPSPSLHQTGCVCFATLRLTQPPSPWITAYELVLFIQWGSIPSYAVSANVANKQFYLMVSYNL